MKQKATENSKINQLARMLKIHRVMAVGLMERLWHWTAAEIPDGGVGKRTDVAIAAECWWPWPKRAAEFVITLRAAGLLDEMKSCRLYVHDWHEHCEDSVHMRLARQRKYFANGDMPNMRKFSKEEKEAILLGYRAHGVRTVCAQEAHGVRTVCAQEAHGVRMVCALPIAYSLKPVASPPVAPICEGESGSGKGEGDEAHRILVAAPELRALTWEQDLTARQFAGGLDFLKAAPEIVKQAELMRDIQHVGAWLRVQYEKAVRKKGVGGGEGLTIDDINSAERNIFRGLES